MLSLLLIWDKGITHTNTAQFITIRLYSYYGSVTKVTHRKHTQCHQLIFPVHFSIIRKAEVVTKLIAMMMFWSAAERTLPGVECVHLDFLGLSKTLCLLCIHIMCMCLRVCEIVCECMWCLCVRESVWECVCVCLYHTHHVLILLRHVWVLHCGVIFETSTYSILEICF